MRPILLKIKGLNSFIEEQVIEFSRLMEPGLFGIFGPTGSGKTTILDGITLALYGEIARKSKNFINTNCKSASVLFEFQISGAETKRYRVEREFRQDANREGYKTGKCRLSDITGEEPVILGDKVTEVNNACIEIIGLKSDDFQRTVVLPQGRFSEFLKLEGKKRSEMLERLFRLQPYGDGLTRKLKIKSDEIGHKRSKLEGQLQAYAEISEESLKDKKQEVLQLKGELENHSRTLQDFLVRYENGKEIWDLQLEQKKHLEQKKLLEEGKSQIATFEEQIEMFQKANKIYPFIKSLETALNEKEKKESILIRIKEERDQSEERKNQAEQQYKLLKQKREEELPLLRQTIQGLKEAIGYQDEYIQLKEQKEKQKRFLAQNETKAKEIRAKETKLKQVIEEYGNKIEELQEKQKKYEISAEVRQQIQAGIGLEQQYGMLLDRMEKEETDFIRLKTEKQKQEDILHKIECVLFPDGVQEDRNLEGLQQYLLEIKEKKKEFTEYTGQVSEKEKELAVCAKDLGLVQKEKKELLIAWEKSKQEKEELEIATLSYKLRTTLQEGKPCPVCGSVHHEEFEVHQITSDKLTQVNKNYEMIEQKLREQEKREVILVDKQKRIEEELQQFEHKAEHSEHLAKAMTLEELTLKMEALPKYQKTLVSFDLLSKSVAEKETSLLKEKEDFKKCKNRLDELLKKVAYSSFAEAADKLRMCDETLEKLTGNLQKGMEMTKCKREELENCLKERSQLETNIAVLKENLRSGEERTAVLQDKFSKSMSFFETISIDDVTLQDRLKQHQKQEQQIEKQYEQAEEGKETEIKHFLQLQNRFIEVNSVFTQLKKQIEEETIRVNDLLKQEQFESKESCLAAILPESELETMKNRIEQYKNESAKNRGVLDKIEKQLNSRKISEEEWTELNTKKIEEETVCETLKLAYSNETMTLKRMESDWEKQKGLQIKLKEIEHQESLMADLMQLFRGKKFVEYVAYSKLQYISKAASHRLRDISNGNYGLELDQSGRFMVCDYKNGGVKRDAFTLSGGETFLVSLSLSLALSEQVQLKGTAPLELFFLDEGFGTLDDELLEVVMSSLERIQNKHLTVGIISHVEVVKNRVPIKLIVSPSVAGLGGTKVHIEKN